MIFFKNEEGLEQIQQSKLRFTKMHGLGNDYLIINCIDNKNEFCKKDIEKITRYLCNRHFGVGADGVILVNKSEIADFKMNIYNLDGSEAQMCGNGIRCFTKYIYDNKMIEKEYITIETLAGIKNAYIRKSAISNEIQEITVDMGKPILERDKIPVIINEEKSELLKSEESSNKEEKVEKVKLDILGKNLEVFCVSMGNPHAIVFCENVENVPIKDWGSLIEKDEHFPEKTNVEFIQILGSSSIKMRVWERGVGETYACGTGACAVGVACHKLGLTKSDVKVYLKGGELKIKIDELTQRVYMTGIATKVFEGEICISNI